MFWVLLFLNSFLAYFVNLTNFLVTKHTSALTLQVGAAPASCAPASPAWQPGRACRYAPPLPAALSRRAALGGAQIPGACPVSP